VIRRLIAPPITQTSPPSAAPSSSADRDQPGFLLIVRHLPAGYDVRRRDGTLSLDVAIIGAGELGRQLIRQLLEEGAGRYCIAGSSTTIRPTATSVEGYPVIGPIDDLVRLAQCGLSTRSWYAALGGRRRLNNARKLKTVLVNVKICPTMSAGRCPVGYLLGGIPMLRSSAASGWQLVVKAIETALAAIALVFAAPLPAIARW
jgi:hypothetical protein